MKLSNIKEWERAKDALYSVYDREYLAYKWPARLGFAELIALQSDGDLNAWKTCIISAVYNGDIPVQDEQWFLGTIEPSEFWTGQKPKTVLIPPCQKHQGDNIAFFSSELVTKCTVSPIDFAEYLKQQDEKPSKYIAAWFDAFGVDREPEHDGDAVMVLKRKMRGRSELTELIRDFLSDKGINVGDAKTITAIDAWGQIVSGKYKSSIISPDNKKREIITNSGKLVDQTKFIKAYNRQFEIRTEPA